MSRAPARFTEADINRAMKVATRFEGFRVRVNKAGDILIERGDRLDAIPTQGLETSAGFEL